MGTAVYKSELVRSMMISAVGVPKERDGRQHQSSASSLAHPPRFLLSSPKMTDVKDTDEETSPREPERGEGKFAFPGGGFYGENYCCTTVSPTGTVYFTPG